MHAKATQGDRMASPIRLSDDLIETAEEQIKHSFRSVPKQIEFWAMIGKKIEAVMSPADIAALTSGQLEIQLLRKNPAAVIFETVIESLENDRNSGSLKSGIPFGDTWYEENIKHPGQIIRHQINGKIDSGIFEKTKFIPVSNQLKKSATKKKIVR
jgi:hypothetical protein